MGVPQDLREILFATAPNPARLITWATIGDSNNNVVIENQTGTPWASNQQRFFIVTPDQASERDVAEALMAAGVDENRIFVEKVAADLVNLGLDPAADGFQIFLRYVQVPNTEAAMHGAHGCHLRYCAFATTARQTRLGLSLIRYPTTK